MIEFYNVLQKKLLQDPYGIALISKIENPVKYFDVLKDFNKLEIVDKEKIKIFLLKMKEVYIIPLELPNKKIYGFLLKAVNSKNFLNYRILENYPLVFGLYDFNNFNFNNTIILVEGIKDCMTVKLLYPFVLAYMTSCPSIKLWNYLISITNKIIFLPDNDEAGRKIEYFKRFKKYAKYYMNGYKDWGEYWEVEKRVEREDILVQLKMILKERGLI